MATVQQVARSPQAATIQPFAPEDEKKVRFIIGKTAFEPLAAANMKGPWPGRPYCDYTRAHTRSQ
jgi:hypothetical protein